MTVGMKPGKEGVINSSNTLKKSVVTIAFHKLSDEIKRGTLGSILKQANIKEH
jgi:predicted RNA binding protein YcfA (HicA-like mRNA interferase family)